jgi:hypothetical protein
MKTVARDRIQRGGVGWPAHYPEEKAKKLLTSLDSTKVFQRLISE